MNNHGTIAYFSMEIGLEAEMPTYSGGLGVLAGDTVRAAADLRVPLVAITLLHRKGYFYQQLDKDGRQSEEASEWVIEDFLREMVAMDQKWFLLSMTNSKELCCRFSMVSGIGSWM